MLFILLLLWFFFQICLQFVLATIQIEWFFLKFGQLQSILQSIQEVKQFYSIFLLC